MQHPEPIVVIDLMPVLDQKLMAVLKGMSMEQWTLPTLAVEWTIKDIAAHLLDGNIRTLSMLRDKFTEESTPNISSYPDLVHYLNTLNAHWVRAMKRTSPGIIIELLEITGKQYCQYLSSLDPFEPAALSVAWAGESTSQNWFHIAREYTEKWHHQQQIRWALSKGQDQELMKDKFYLPYLETSLRALPYHYRNVSANPGDLIKLVIVGESEKIWFLQKTDKHWELVANGADPITCEIIINGDVAWRIFSKGISYEQAMEQSEIKGQQELGRHIFKMVAVMA